MSDATPPPGTEEVSLRIASAFLLGIAVGICAMMVWKAIEGPKFPSRAIPAPSAVTEPEP
jgi:hypothetical protein